jgi:hypothetical protein
MKKISTAGLKRLIREELFYREFHRHGDELNEQDEFPEEVEPHDSRQLHIGALHPDQLAKIREYSNQLLAIHEALEEEDFMDELTDPESIKHDGRMSAAMSGLWDLMMILGTTAEGSG